MSNNLQLDCFMKVAVNLATSAGEIMKSATVDKKNTVMKENPVDLVTEYDQSVEKFLIAGFHENFPDHKFVGEETAGCVLTDDPTWIIDPIDGTMNFVHKFPFSAISIGFAVNKEICLGVIYNPWLQKMYTGCKDKGSYCNGKPISTSKETDLSKALILSEFGSTRTTENVEQIFTNLKCVMDKAHGMRMLGSAALNMCAVASGEADAYFEYTIHCWDMAAGKIIVQEAGGCVVDPEGGPLDLMSRRVLCASSKSLAETLSKELTHIQHPRDDN